jgi:adenylosuccinate synthase
MINSLVIIGSQWGDEGKGKVVDWLMQKSDIVVRFQGGHNAGHTLVINGKKIVLHLLPSGVLHESVISCLGNGMVVSLPDLFKEISSLAKQEVFVENRVKISESCHLLLPYHVALDKAREIKRGSNAIGTTGKGIGPAYEDKVARRGVRISDLLSGESVFLPMLEQAADFHNFVLKNYYNQSAIDLNQVVDELLSYKDKLEPMVANIGDLLISSVNKKVVFEGAQGAALDIDHGTYPFVTSSNTSSAQAAIGSGVGPLNISNVLGITKVYATRVGSGPFPTELDDEDGKNLSTIGAEIGATTGRKRRCGWLDIVALRHSIDTNSINKLCLTKLDVLDSFSSIKICTAYNFKGKILHKPPVDINSLSECVPIYEELSGWQKSTVGLTNVNDLPEYAKIYINRVSELLSVPVVLVSTSPERDHFIQLDSLF